MSGHNEFHCVMVIPRANRDAVNALFQAHYGHSWGEGFSRKLYRNGVHAAYMSAFPLRRDLIVRGDTIVLLRVANQLARSATYLWVDRHERRKLHKLAVAADFDVAQYRGRIDDPGRTHGVVRLLTSETGGHKPITISQIVRHCGCTLHP